VNFVDSRPVVVGVSSEGDAEQLKEAVHAVQQTLGRVSNGVHGWRSLEYDHPVSEISGHDEIVLHHKSGFLRVKNEP
jgi:hypothetical protein